MKKKKKRMLSIAGMCCCGFLAAVTAVSGTSAYLTDHEEIVNVINMGHHTAGSFSSDPDPGSTEWINRKKSAGKKHRRCTLLCTCLCDL